MVMRTICFLLLASQAAVAQYNKPFGSDSVQLDRLINKMDSLSAQTAALSSEYEANEQKARQDHENLIAELPRVSSLDELFVLMKKYPLHDSGKGVRDQILMKFYTLNEANLSSLDPNSAEFRKAKKINETRLAEEHITASDAVHDLFSERESNLNQRRILADHRKQLEHVAEKIIRSSREEMALDTQRETLNEIRELRRDIDDSNQRLINEVNQSEWRLRNQ